MAPPEKAKSKAKRIPPGSIDATNVDSFDQDLDWGKLTSEQGALVDALWDRAPSSLRETVTYIQQRGYFPCNPELNLYGFGLPAPKQGLRVRWRQEHTAIKDQFRRDYRLNTYGDQERFENDLRLAHCISPISRAAASTSSPSGSTYGTPSLTTAPLPVIPEASREGLPSVSRPSSPAQETAPEPEPPVEEPPEPVGVPPPAASPKPPSSHHSSSSSDNEPETATMAQNAVTLKNTAKVNPPREFDGTPSKCSRFIRELRMYKRLKPSDFDEDLEWIFWALSYMRGSDFVEAWAASIMDEMEKENPDDRSEFYMGSWKEFIEDLEKTFGDPDKEGTARDEMKELKQKEGETVEQFYHRFREIAIRSASSEKDLFIEFKSKIRPFISMRVASHDPEPDNIKDWANKAIAIDKQLKRNPATVAFLSSKKKSSPSTPSSSSRIRFSSGGQLGGRVSFNPPSTSTQAPSISQRIPPSISQSFRPSQPGPSTQTQQTSRIRNLSCWFCKKEGHISTQCPQKRMTTQMTHQEIHQMVTFYQDMEKEMAGHLNESEVVEEDSVGIDELDMAALDFQHEDE